ncbi:hypothetical protein [Mycobacterium deserti]|uniref:PE family protein n=1 Tax=Mycobacterium deserti TaxID=2978347 RepID=A0ABT2M4X1_9MYCO|nr:hypothetical protein [Mycobacterium deserti]MCT7656996.1 hypothetical protein [Mycobacterium deserti]
MKFFTRSLVAAGAALMTAGTVAIAQAEPIVLPAVAKSSVEVTSAERPMMLPHQSLQLAIAPNLANAIDNAYLAVEPWVQYGFELATAAVAWIPYVGWFSGQIMVLYDFGESIVASGVFNFTDVLRGDGGIIANLVDFGIDVGLAFVWLGLDELAQFVPLPPFCCYPPRPPVQGPFLAAETVGAPLADTMTATSLEETPSEIVKETATQDEDVTEQEILAEEESATDDGDLGEEPGEEDVTTEDVTQTTDTAGTVAAQGEIRDGLNAAENDEVDAGPTADPSENNLVTDARDTDSTAPKADVDADTDSASEGQPSP